LAYALGSALVGVAIGAIGASQLKFKLPVLLSRQAAVCK
jgi:hypothetical protein